VGPYAAGGSGFYGGVDYFNLVNITAASNGVKIQWEERERPNTTVARH
jgi:branched-chain amino acid transport system substrate-binding protein